MPGENKNTRDEANGPNDPQGKGGSKGKSDPEDARGSNGQNDPEGQEDPDGQDDFNGSDDPAGSDYSRGTDVPGQVNESGGAYGAREPLTFEKVWLMFRETRDQMRESFKETRDQMREAVKETDRKWQATDRKWQEADKRFRDTERLMKEQSKQTDRKIQEAARLISELREEYKNRWGELVESLVSGSLLRILQARGIPVRKIRQRVRNYKGEPNYELDIVASNGDEVVVVEVKSVLNPEAVKHFISQLNLVRNSSRRFRQQRMIGAVAFLKDHCDAAEMAMNRGLLAIRATGDSAVILNEKDVEPTRF